MDNLTVVTRRADNLIVVTRRADDFHACIDGQPGLWDAGRTAAEAIGKLVLTHREHLGIKVQLPNS